MGCINTKRNIITTSFKKKDFSSNPNNEDDPFNTRDRNSKSFHTQRLNSSKGKIIDKTNLKSKFSNSNDMVKSPNSVKSSSKVTEHKSSKRLIHLNCEITDEDNKKIKSALENHFLFKDQTKLIINQVIGRISIIEIKSNSVLFKEGDEGNLFYIVKEGVLEMKSDSKTEPKYLKAGDTIGVVALIHNYKRTSSVKCLETAKLYFLEGNAFRNIIVNANKDKLKDRIFFLSLIKIFAGLNNVQMHNIALSMFECSFEENQIIIQGESMYIIKEGNVKCIKGDVEVRQLSNKDYFGESAILFGHKRSMSIIPATRTSCFQISSSSLIENLGDEYKETLLKSISKEAFRNSLYMKLLVINNYFDKIFPVMKQVIYKDGDFVLSKSCNVDVKKIIICVEGNLHFDSTHKEKIAMRGELFGDKFINDKESLKYDITASANCITLEITWEEIIANMNLDIDPKKVLNFLKRLSHMKKNQILRHTSDSRLVEICKMMNKEKFQSGEILFKEKESGDKLYLIKKGKVKVVKQNKLLREIEEGNCFGEVSLLVNAPRSATIIAETEVTTYTLSKDDFVNIIDKKMLEFLTKKLSLQDNFMTTLNDLYNVKNLGQGKFGSVSLVHNKRNLYAIKAVYRKSVEKQKILIKYLIEEKNILLSIEHPFIMKLVKTMKNEDYLFFLTEYINGISLSRYLEDKSSDSTNKFEVQFYVAILLIVVDYLNSKSICHRDIKPDNIMIDEKGYLKLIDFGTSVVIKDFTSTITGTPHYIAPEILSGKGYSFSCDYWSVGIIAYELSFAMYPFGQNATDPMEVYKEILKKDVYFCPKKCQDKSIKSFLNSILKKKVSERVCNLEMLKQTDFFFEFNWNEVIDFNLSAPFVPNVYQNSNSFNTNIKYIEKLKKKIPVVKESILSSYEDDGKVSYNSNWVDEF